MIVPTGTVDLVKSFASRAAICDTFELFVWDQIEIMTDEKESPEEQEEAKKMLEFVFQYPDFVSAYFTGIHVRDISRSIGSLSFVLREFFYDSIAEKENTST